MVRYFNTFEGGTAGQQITPSNSGGASGTAFNTAFGSGISSYVAAAAIQGALGMQTESGTTVTGFNADFTATGALAISFEFSTSAQNASADLFLARLTDASDNRWASVHINSAGKLRVADNTGTSGVFTSTDVIAPNTKYRVELYIKSGTSTTTGTVQFAYFLAGSTTAIQTFSSTALNVGTGSPYTRFRFGRITAPAAANVMTFDDVVWETDATGFTGPFVPAATPLATPVVTLGAKTDPSASGAADGKQTVSWPAVSGAASYEAWIANKDNPAQSDFTLVATGVTSPYQFTGLSAGTRAYGIKAKV